MNDVKGNVDRSALLMTMLAYAASATALLLDVLDVYQMLGLPAHFADYGHGSAIVLMLVAIAVSIRFAVIVTFRRAWKALLMAALLPVAYAGSVATIVLLTSVPTG